jgi:methionyl-tRNA formyltransferase
MTEELKITILSDRDSWINQYLNDLIEQLKKYKHNVEWVHQASDISRGDLVFCLGCSQIMSKEILELNQHNLVVHESELPQGKGWSPLTWQILEGKNEIPICLFEAQEGVDSGYIYLKDKLIFQGTELVEELRQTQAKVSIKMCLEFVLNYPHIVSQGQPQKGESTFYSRRTPKDSKLNPDKTLKEQFNLLRVVDNQHYPAFFELYGNVYALKIERRD